MKIRNNVRGLLIAAIAACTCFLLAACAGGQASSGAASSAQSGSAASASSASPTSGSSAANLSEQSILLFDGDEGSAKLVADMEAGRIPTNCNVLYDTMGARPAVDVTDPDTITQIYEALSKVNVMGESTMSVTDSYHHVTFTLQDGTTVGFGFEGAGLLVRGRTNYAVANSGDLWSLVCQIQDDYMNPERPTYSIRADDEDGVIGYYPREAKAGEMVAVEAQPVLDVIVRVQVNGEDIGEFIRGDTYIFEMPESDVVLTVAYEDYPGGGA